MKSDIKADRGAIKVYYCHYDRIDEPSLIDQYCRLLDREERKRWQGIRSESGKRCFLVSRAMLRTLLGAAVNCSPAALSISPDAHGKPCIRRPGTHWSFNLSHSRGLVALALAYDTDIGIDVECRTRKVDALKLARHFFHSVEIRQLEQRIAEERRQHFFKLWTLKEAYCKAVGTGLAHPLDSFGFSFQQQDTVISLQPTPRSPVDCWQAQLEQDFIMAVVAFSRPLEVPDLQLYDFLPNHHCTGKQPDTLLYSAVPAVESEPVHSSLEK